MTKFSKKLLALAMIAGVFSGQSVMGADPGGNPGGNPPAVAGFTSGDEAKTAIISLSAQIMPKNPVTITPIDQAKKVAQDVVKGDTQKKERDQFKTLALQELQSLVAEGKSIETAFNEVWLLIQAPIVTTAFAVMDSTYTPLEEAANKANRKIAALSQNIEDVRALHQQLLASWDAIAADKLIIEAEPGLGTLLPNIDVIDMAAVILELDKSVRKYPQLISIAVNPDSNVTSLEDAVRVWNLSYHESKKMQRDPNLADNLKSMFTVIGGDATQLKALLASTVDAYDTSDAISVAQAAFKDETDFSANLSNVISGMTSNEKKNHAIAVTAAAIKYAKIDPTKQESLIKTVETLANGEANNQHIDLTNPAQAKHFLQFPKKLLKMLEEEKQPVNAAGGGDNK